MAEKRSCWGATRNNLIFNDVRIFRVGDPVTLKMLNSFIVSLLRGAPYVESHDSPGHHQMPGRSWRAAAWPAANCAAP